MLAAIITPAANPRKIRWTVGSGRLRKKNTVAAPRAVSRAVNPVPPAAHNSACANVLFPFPARVTRRCDRRGAH